MTDAPDSYAVACLERYAELDRISSKARGDERGPLIAERDRAKEKAERAMRAAGEAMKVAAAGWTWSIEEGELTRYKPYHWMKGGRV